MPTTVVLIPVFDIYDTKDPDLSPVPDIFLCDEQGYPYWCSSCNSIKPKRSFHIKGLNRCVPRFDHKCIWIGTSIGRDNILFFLQFLVEFGSLFIIALISAAATARPAFDRDWQNIPHYVVIFACSVLWLPMILGLLLQQFAFAFTNRTTIDDISMKQAKKYNEWRKGDESNLPKCLRNNYQREETGVRYVNLKTKSSRVVVPFFIQDDPYSEGFTRNVTRLVYGESDKALFWSAMFHICFPFGPLLVKRSVSEVETYDTASEPFSRRFLELINKKVSNADCKDPIYLQKDISQTN
ncbi:hypothetical protein CXQ85_001782 [Candidozyma haemuli]|uniref:Palmitoyltransferase n=1 Tax=Candidozyma haemuli TaxID=45357 RepID=A0A2V1AQD7_9ASCO|nr:hypothetical protein CXQ85_001782 [[Candida] haemuloni]PVH20005.1 hypothetical protein CXQ85_001782 [[Candida] haemuloni]